MIWSGSVAFGWIISCRILRFTAAAMIPYNDSFSDYLDMLIKDEQTKEEVDKDRIDQLIEDKRTYEKKKQIIIRETSSADSDGKVIQIERIYEMRKELCCLKHNGKDLKEALDGIMYARTKTIRVERKKTHVKAKGTFSGVGDAVTGFFQKLSNPFSSRKASSSSTAAAAKPKAV